MLVFRGAAVNLMGVVELPVSGRVDTWPAQLFMKYVIFVVLTHARKRHISFDGIRAIIQCGIDILTKIFGNEQMIIYGFS